MKKIGLITSGGDAPGMNAAIRAVVRTSVGRGLKVVGFMRGWSGVVHSSYMMLDSQSVGGIITKGGTILRTARCDEFLTPEGRAQAMQVLRDLKVEGLVVIGGDGSLKGAKSLHDEHRIPVMGVPGSIDNDISGTDFSIGFDTAINTAMDAIDKVRDTAYSHDRVFVVEVMGRRNGFIALDVALAGGAEAALLPELPFSLPDICDSLRAARQKGKSSSIIVVAEGASKGADIADYIQEDTGFETRYISLGHVQRGGSPTAFDRTLALRLGSWAAHRLIAGATCEMAGIEGGKMANRSLEYCLTTERRIDADRLLLLDVMAR